MYEILYAYILIIRKKTHIVMGQSTPSWRLQIYFNPATYMPIICYTKTGNIFYMFRVRLISFWLNQNIQCAIQRHFFRVVWWFLFSNYIIIVGSLFTYTLVRKLVFLGKSPVKIDASFRGFENKTLPFLASVVFN